MAFQNLLVQLWNEPGEPTPYEDSQDLALAWFTDPKAKEEVAEILGRFHLDETAIEAEAIKSLAAELEVLDRMLMTLEVRRNRAIRGVAECRETFAKRVEEGSDRIIEAETILRLTDDGVPRRNSRFQCRFARLSRVVSRAGGITSTYSQ
ncbi:hypothetical protein LJR220_007042 [Bradyrhizobium sp. LjRoot220]|uniref:hypothetical protein n=1 Tax=Bradyrhizobium sp. LjRoot220 TaxID=3342284 RepID=UPI003ECD5A5E